MTANSSVLAANSASSGNKHPNSINFDDLTQASIGNAESLAPLVALCAIARFHQIAANPATLAHQLGLSASDPLTTSDVLRAAQQLGIKAKLSRSSVERLGLTPLPALAVMRTPDDALHLVILAQSDGKRVLFQDGATGRPTIEPAKVFASQWSGELILISSRASVAGALAKFDFSWFIPALVKYRRLLSEVLLISFMLQLFGLVSPLFFQVVMDKVLVHKGMTTLDVLVNDSLLGGKGNDTYVFQTGDGLDTILDSDGQGSIVYDGDTLTGGAQYGDARVHRDDSGHLYVNVGAGRLVIDGNILIENQDVGELGLTMTDAAADVDPTTSLPIRSDFAPIDFDPNTAGVQTQTDSLGNIKTNPITPQPDRDDTYIYNVGDGVDNIYDTRGENNILRFGAGVNKDNVKLNLGSLLLNLGNGDAVHIEGFDQNDVFNSSTIDGFEFADGTTLTTNELLARGATNDAKYGNSFERKAA